MRKFLVMLAVTAAISIAWKQQTAEPLANTSWRGTLLVPDAMNGVLSFSKDSLTASINYEVVETNHYRVNGDTLFLTKLSGSSPCGSEEASYIYSIKDDVLYLKLVKDACEIRSGAFSPEGYKKEKN